MSNSLMLFAQESGSVLTEQTGFWTNMFQDIDADKRFVLFIIGISCITALAIIATAVIAGVYTSIQKQRMLNELKQDMLDRGMSGEEIAEVVKAAPVEDFFSRWADHKFSKRK